MNWLILVFFASVLALAYAGLNFFSVKRLDEGTAVMKDIASSIRLGAVTFLNYEFRIIAVVAVAVALLMGLVVSWHVAAAFAIGAVMSSLAAVVGMRIATYANVRVIQQGLPKNWVRPSRSPLKAVPSWVFVSAALPCSAW